VVGSSSSSRWQELKGSGSVVRKIARLAGVAGIDVHIIARRHLSYEAADSTEIGEST
jgi:K+-sensing histidine kinase KdpD